MYIYGVRARGWFASVQTRHSLTVPRATTIFNNNIFRRPNYAYIIRERGDHMNPGCSSNIEQQVAEQGGNPFRHFGYVSMQT